MANYFEYTAGREGDHAVTMCVKIQGDISQAQRMDFDTANKVGAAGAFQCESVTPGSFVNHNGIEVVPICFREQASDPWQVGWTTPSGGNEAWNYGKAENVAHAYQSTVMPLAASECQEPVTTQQAATVQPVATRLPAVGAHTDIMLAAVIAIAAGLAVFAKRVRA